MTPEHRSFPFRCLRNLCEASAHQLVVIASAALIASCVPELPDPEPTPVAALAIVVDASLSGSRDQRCAQVEARVRRALDLSERVDLLVLGTGDQQTDGEPRVFVSWARHEPARRMYANDTKDRADRERFTAGVVSRCRAAYVPTNVTPLYKSLHRALDSLEARCAELSGSEETCKTRMLAVHSDFRETVDPAIAERIFKQGRRTRAARDLPTLPTEGIELNLCGIAETRSVGKNKSTRRPGAIVEVWREVLGREALHIEAGCPKSAMRSEE